MALRSTLRKKKTNSRPISPSSRGNSRVRTENIYSKPVNPVGSKGPLRISHKPSRTYGGKLPLEGPGERANKILKDELSKTNPFRAPLISSKNNTPRNKKTPVFPRSAKHRRVNSNNERPLSTYNGSKASEKSHNRRFSLEKIQPSSLMLKYAHVTRCGMIPGNSGKTNQDSYFEFLNFGGNPEHHLFGVFDGHGFYGREVSTFVRERLPKLLVSDPFLNKDTKKAIHRSVFRIEQEVVEEVDVNFSGTTLILIFIKGKTIYCANVGDSRALLARQIEEQDSSNWMAIALSRDHKPDLEDESERILGKGGRIEAYQDEEGNSLGPARVWLRHQDLPGLAMSRSIGDAVASSVGVICTPEILEFEITPQDKFLVLGSDGIFEFLNNEDIVRIVVPHWKKSDVQGATENLGEEAKLKWQQEEEVIDDITAICIFIKSA